MAGNLNLSVGRVRVTRATHPSEAGYVVSIRNQMKLLQANLLKVIDHVNAVTPEALVFGLQPIFDESQRLVPVDKGPLKASGFIETRKTAHGAQAAMGYGRYGRVGYAAFVHERLDIRHRSPTQAKFLETAINTKLDTFARRVVLYYQRSTGIKE